MCLFCTKSSLGGIQGFEIEAGAHGIKRQKHSPGTRAVPEPTRPKELNSIRYLRFPVLRYLKG
jgi:hypothetical protein